ncbi:GTP cyclohydrolase FolE2 [Caballeronia sp. LP006]|uniref:GTP cyclohydrolase FolE2 n=1 Tax=Caballeronia sp. LP006 TaxID=3038552 RepID=UPI002855DDAB|nr:GTP cyclohydrolase FolE2 [Caballeronia sp. LP006]MDR5832205.1 GTP cyclohydrolase FolE2 [Caballeronia sp. LP006]
MNNIDPNFLMPDVQAFPDNRRIAIRRVGVRGIRRPVAVRMRGAASATTVGVWNMDVYLPASQKGTHMSRFIELLERHTAALSTRSLFALLTSMQEALETHAGRIDVSFPLFLEKAAPVSQVSSLMDYEVTMTGEITREDARITLKVLVPVTSLCPCSKKISRHGAHNQRSHVTITATVTGDIAPEELIAIAEQEASCELWGLLKRPDEKYVTERAYENPKFVEDLVRDIAHRLYNFAGIESFVVEAENFESIHNHSAYALVDSSDLTEDTRSASQSCECIA